MASADKKTKIVRRRSRERRGEKSTKSRQGQAKHCRRSLAKADAGDTAAAPKGYSRGEGQKPVTQAYKDNWNAMYAKEEKEDR